MNETIRVCRSCGSEKPLSAFHSGVSGSGVRYWKLDCRACVGADRRTQYQTDPLFRALQSMRTMETKVKRLYPAVWVGSIAQDGAAKLLAAKHCAYCQMPNDGTQPFNVDHHVPLALGGAHSLDNLRPCCEPCNRAKHDMPPADFDRWMKGLVSRLVAS